MIRQTLAHFPHGALSGLAMLLFMGVFLGAILWVYRGGSRSFYDSLSRSPLNDQEGIKHD